MDNHGEIVMNQREENLIIVSIILFLSAGCIEHDLTHYEEIREEISRVNINSDSLDVTVAAATDDVSTVDIDVDYRGSAPGYIVSVTDKTLYISLECGNNCGGNLVVNVPAEAAAQIDLDSGNATVRDLTGGARVSVDSGNIEVRNLAGDLDLQSDAGNINGTVESRYCVADTDAGNISLTFNETPDEIDVSTNSGNIRLKVPEGSYQVDTRVDLGNTDVDNLTQDSDAQRLITAETDSGNIEIIGF